MFHRALLGCALALAIPATAAPSQQTAHAGLAAELTRILHSHPEFGIFDDVEVEIEDGAAVLTGRVTSKQKRSELGARAARVAGVRTVRNDLSVLPPSKEDDDLRYRIARALYGHPAFWSHAARPNPPIHILVEAGHVTLTGVVDTPAERALAHSLASGFGERSLSSRLRVRGTCAAATRC
jgi:hyperosmotically inducible periplasmic protein